MSSINEAGANGANCGYIPCRMINEYVYCPRLAYMEWVQGEWASSVDTAEGVWTHRNVDMPETKVDLLKEGGFTLRSVILGSGSIGIIAKIDLIEGEANRVSPVEYKKGRRPHAAKGAWDPERVQLCAHGLLLKEHGFHCDGGIIYFAGSRERVRIPFDDELIQLTMDAIASLRAFQEATGPPLPLEDNKRCRRCSLLSICLPDEVNALCKDMDVRPVYPQCENALPLYVQEPGSRIKKNGDVLEIWFKDEKKTEARLNEISHAALYGPVDISTPAVHELLRRGISLSYHSSGGWLLGQTAEGLHKNIELRISQYGTWCDPQKSLALAKGLVAAKILNARTLLMRNTKDKTRPSWAFPAMKHYANKAFLCKNSESLLGIEGGGAACYFEAFTAMLSRDSKNEFAFDFNGRNKRPPPDPINTMLSFGYAMLARECASALMFVGLDPYLGFYHRPRYGKPSLALDMMEPFRPIIADSVVITAMNNKEIVLNDFLITKFGCAFTGNGKKKFIRAFERRMSQEVTHPIFGYRLSYRRLIEVQARLLGRYLTGEIPAYPNFRTR